MRNFDELDIEKISNLYQLAEFGKLSAGLFHDLMNHLMTVMACVHELEHSEQDIPKTRMYLQKAVSASRRIGDHLGIIRKQIKTSEPEQLFSLNKEVAEAVEIVRYRARQLDVSISIIQSPEVITYGCPIKFYQAILNLITNAIDSYYDCTTKSNRTVTITINQKRSHATITVLDNGIGIKSEHTETIFEPFFTTKSTNGGMGIGLATTKNNIENYFHGTISVVSTPNKGTKFTIQFPIQNIRTKNLTSHNKLL